MPVYNLFQHYFFPVDMDFLNTLSEEYIIKDKFESFGTSEDFHTLFTVKGFMSKYLERPDQILVKFVRTHEDQYPKINDNSFIQVLANYNYLMLHKDDSHLLIKTKTSDKNNAKDKNSTYVLSFEKNNIDFNDQSMINVLSSQIETQDYQDKESILVSVSLTNEKQIEDTTKINLNLNFNDPQNDLNDEAKAKTLRANYLNYNTLDNYLIFYNEQFRKESSYLDNYNYKNTNLNDLLYFSIVNLF
jgi:hypothetical protein